MRSLATRTKRAQFDRGEIDADGKPRFQGFEGFGGGRGGRAPAAISRVQLRPAARSVRAARGARGRRRRGYLLAAFRRCIPRRRGAARRGRAQAAKGEDVEATLDRHPRGYRRARPRSACGCRPARRRRGDPEGVSPTARSSACAGWARARRRRSRATLLLTIRFAPARALHASRASTCALACRSASRRRCSAATVRVPTLTGRRLDGDPADDEFRPDLPAARQGPAGRRRGHGDLLATTEIRLPEVIDEDLMDYARKRRPPRPTRVASTSKSAFRPLRRAAKVFPLATGSAKEADLSDPTEGLGETWRRQRRPAFWPASAA